MNAKITPAERIVVFIDEDNVYKDARRCFFAETDPAHVGRINPMKYAMELARQQPLGTTEPRALAEVRVYTGMPSPRDPAVLGPRRRQIAGWQNAGVTVIARPLRYPADWPKSKPQQKGVDVQLALDVALGAVRGDFDVGIVASTDTDLIPALEACYDLESCPTLEVAAWNGPGSQKRLRLPKALKHQHLWCHMLDRQAFEQVKDLRNYSQR